MNLSALQATAMALAATVASVATAEDVVSSSPDIYTVLFENDNVRVMDVTYEPGERDYPHSHPRYAVMALTGGTIRIHAADSAPTDTTVEKGQVLLLDPVANHWGENVGDTTIHIIAVEFKGPE